MFSLCMVIETFFFFKKCIALLFIVKSTVYLGYIFYYGVS